MILKYTKYLMIVEDPILFQVSSCQGTAFSKDMIFGANNQSAKNRRWKYQQICIIALQGKYQTKNENNRI